MSPRWRQEPYRGDQFYLKLGHWDMPAFQKEGNQNTEVTQGRTPGAHEDRDGVAKSTNQDGAKVARKPKLGNT